MEKLKRRTAWTAGVVGVASAMGLAGLLPAVAEDTNEGNRATANLIGLGGNSVGRVTFTEVKGGVLRVTADVSGLSGFHGFHIHAGSACLDATTGTANFLLAGGHLGHDANSATHRDHRGDMPVLLAKSDGTAATRFETTRVSIDDIRGRTVIVHALADNFANIPFRYGSADAATLATGDAGNRLACGVILGGG